MRTIITTLLDIAGAICVVAALGQVDGRLGLAGAGVSLMVFSYQQAPRPPVGEGE